MRLVTLSSSDSESLSDSSKQRYLMKIEYRSSSNICVCR